MNNLDNLIKLIDLFETAVINSYNNPDVWVPLGNTKHKIYTPLVEYYRRELETARTNLLNAKINS
jgi:hypothetical protein